MAARQLSAAQRIRSAAGGELFEIRTVAAYPSDYQATVDQARRELDQNARPALASRVENINDYDIILVGSPIWWGIAAWPVDSFVEGNDFTGKTVIPFCTSASSGLGESGELLKEKAGTGDWQEGMRFSSGVSEEDVRNWVSGLDV